MQKISHWISIRTSIVNLILIGSGHRILTKNNIMISSMKDMRSWGYWFLCLFANRLILAAYCRSQELQADLESVKQLGNKEEALEVLRYLHKEQGLWKPYDFSSFLNRIFALHPSLDQHIENIQSITK
jgi:Zn-dependent protease with chaperone function